MNAFDTAVYQAINGLAGQFVWLDAFFSFIAEYATILYAVMFILFWFTLPRSKPEMRNRLVVAVFAGVLALIINFIISHFIWARPRPFVALDPGTFNQLIPHDADASFPSDHTAGSFAFASAVWGSHKAVSYAFTTLAILTMFSRVYTGVHWPTDVIAGLLVGVLAGLLVKRFAHYFKPLTRLGLKIFRLEPKK